MVAGRPTRIGLQLVVGASPEQPGGDGSAAGTCQQERDTGLTSLVSRQRLLSLAQRQRERERRPLPNLALHPDPPAVELDELPA